MLFIQPITSHDVLCIYIKQASDNQRSNCQHPLDRRESKGIPERNIYFCFIGYFEAFYCVDHNTPWKVLKEMRLSDHITIFWETYMQVKKQQIEPDIEQ